MTTANNRIGKCEGWRHLGLRNSTFSHPPSLLRSDGNRNRRCVLGVGPEPSSRERTLSHFSLTCKWHLFSNFRAAGLMTPQALTGRSLDVTHADMTEVLCCQWVSQSMPLSFAGGTSGGKWILGTRWFGKNSAAAATNCKDLAITMSLIKTIPKALKNVFKGFPSLLAHDGQKQKRRTPQTSSGIYWFCLYFCI